MSGPSVKVALADDKVLVIPTSSIDEDAIHGNNKSPEDRRKSSYIAFPCSSQPMKNYLLKGGHRAIDKQLQYQWTTQKERTISDLVTANEALAKELIRWQKEHKTLRDQIEQEKSSMSSAFVQKEENERALKEALRLHDCRIRELQKKIREEHYMRAQTQEIQQMTASKIETLEQENNSIKEQQAANIDKIKQQTDTAVQLTKQLKEKAENVTQKEAELKERSQEIHALREAYENLRKRSSFLQKALESLTKQAGNLSEKKHALSSLISQHKDAQSKADARILEQQKTIDANDQVVAGLRNEIHTLHDLLNTERVTCSEHQTNEKRLTSDLYGAQSQIASLQSTCSQQDSEMLKLKSRLMTEQNNNQELIKRCTQTKAQLETSLSDNKKKETEWHSDTKMKLDTIKRDRQKKENSYLTELRNYKRCLKNTKAELEALTEQSEVLRHEKDALESEVSSLNAALASSEERAAGCVQALAEMEKELECTKVELNLQEERFKQNVAAHAQNQAECEASLHKERTQCVQLKEELAQLQKSLNLNDESIKNLQDQANNDIAARDKQIQRFGETVKSLSTNLRAAKESQVAEHERHEQQLAAWRQEKAGLENEMSGTREQLHFTEQEVECLKKELTRLETLLVDKETEIQVAKKEAVDESVRTSATLKERESAIDALKLSCDKQEQIIQDLVDAMQAEETSKKAVQRSLEMAVEKNKTLETQLSASQTSLRSVISDGDAAKEACSAMREKAEALKEENASLMEKYDDLAAKVIQESRSSAKTGKSGDYSDRLAALMKQQ